MAMTKPKTSKKKEKEQKATSPKAHKDAAQDKKLINKMMNKKGCK